MTDKHDSPLTRRNILKITGGVGVGTVVGFSTPTAAQTKEGDVIWHYDLRGRRSGRDANSSPTIVDGRVYVGSSEGSDEFGEGSLHAFDAEDGTEQWEFEANSRVDKAPLVINGTVYVPSADENLYAVNAADGTEQWRFESGSQFGTSPTASDGTVFIGNQNDNLYAIDAADSTELWAFDAGGGIESSPVVLDGTVYATARVRRNGSSAGNLYAIDAADGTEQWTFEADDPIYDLTVAGGTVYVGGGSDENLYAINAADGTERWAFDTDGFLGDTPTVADSTVYIATSSFRSDDRLYAINTADGTEQWQFEIESSFESSPTVASGMVFIGSADGLYAVDVADGTDQWMFETEPGIESSPTVVDGAVYVADNDATLHALDAGVQGRSEGSRVQLGTLGHHHAFLDRPAQSIGERNQDQGNDTEITPESVTLRNVPVERGGSANDPIVQIAGVTDTNGISLEATYNNEGAEQTETFDFEAVDASAEAVDQPSALTQVTLDVDELDPGTWVDLKIVDSDDNIIVDSIGINHPEDGWLLEHEDLGYYVFKEIVDVRFIIGVFADEQDEHEPEQWSAWARARALDVNHYLGSARGVLGQIGIRPTFEGVSSPTYTIENRATYDEIDSLITDLADEYESVAGETPDTGVGLWIGVHTGQTVSADNNIGLFTRNPLKETAPWVYAANQATSADGGITPADTDAYALGLHVLLHELGHAHGFVHTSINSDTFRLVREQCLMASGVRGATIRIDDDNTYPDGPLQPTSPLSQVQRLSPTLGLSDSGAIGDLRNLLDTVTIPAGEIVRTRRLLRDYMIDLHGVETAGILPLRDQTHPANDTVSTPIIDTESSTGRRQRYVVEFRSTIGSPDPALLRGIDGAPTTFDPQAGAITIYRIGPGDSDRSSGLVPELSDVTATLRGRSRCHVLTGWTSEQETTDTEKQIQVGTPDRPWVIEKVAPEHEYVLQFGAQIVPRTEPAATETANVTVEKVQIHDDEMREMSVGIPPFLGFAIDPSEGAVAANDESSQDHGSPENVTYTEPTIDLRAVDGSGRITGLNSDGEYVNEIPGAVASGYKDSGVEWIAVPADTSIEFSVDSSAVDQYLNDIVSQIAMVEQKSVESVSEAIGQQTKSVEYEVAETVYTENADIEETNGEISVSGTTTRVQTKTVDAGDQRDATIANPDGDIDLVDIRQATAEEPGALTFRNRGEEQLELNGWLLTVDRDQSYTFSEESIEPGAELTLEISQESDTEQGQTWETDATLPSPDGGVVNLRTSDGETVLEVAYDSRGRIRFDQDLTDDTGDSGGTGTDETGNSDDEGIDTLTLLGLLGGAGVAGYALKQRLSSETE